MSKAIVSVVLVEDDPDEKEIFVSFLHRRTDLNLAAFFETGPAFLGYMASQPADLLPGLIMLDHNMPRVTGFQVLQELKANPLFADIPVVVYSTYVDAGLGDRCLRAGAVAVFTKPLTAAGYNEMMDEILLKIGNR